MGNKQAFIRQIPGYPGYYASRDGNIYHLKKSTGDLYLCKGSEVHNGYITVNISNNHTKHRRKVHRLVALTFIPNPECYNVVCHKDNNPKNNSVDNLYWSNQSMNMQQMVNDGRQRKSKIKQYGPKVRELYSQGFSFSEIARAMRLSVTSTRRLVKDRRYNNYCDNGK